MRQCTRCLYNETVIPISFDEQGVCSYCKIHDSLDLEYPTGAAGERRMRELAEGIRREGRGKKYDVIVGVSGGCDSSYLLYLTKTVLGLRPLAVHFDNTWNSTMATENIHAVLKALDVDLYTYVVDNAEYDDIYRSFMEAGVPEIETPTDIALTATLRRACRKFGVRFIFEGHSFRTEGISPLGWLYMDGKYVESVHKAYGTRKLKTYPNLLLPSFLRDMLFSNTRYVRPLWYMQYHKQEAMKFLIDKLGWKWYGGHHLENRFAAFQHAYIYPRRWGIDSRLLGFSALVRSGQITREEGLELLRAPISCDAEIVELVKKRLSYSDEEFERVMNLPKRSYREFTTYKQTFENLRWFFWLMYKAKRVPKSFYIKYCHPNPLVERSVLELPKLERELAPLGHTHPSLVTLENDLAIAHTAGETSKDAFGEAT
jgi:N-acetyl sugar amidotransferase